MTREEINEERQKEISRKNNLERAKKIIIFSIKFTLIATIIISIFLAYTTYISTVKIGVREYRLNEDELPKQFDGLKIIHFSDLHYGGTMREENLKEIIKIINDRKPDIVVYTGDLIEPHYKISEKEKEILSKNLKEINTTLGKYAILGDEDTYDISTLYNQADFNLLKNEYDLIYKNDNNPIMIIGLSSILSEEQNMEQGYSFFSQENANSNIFTITLIHEPDSSKEIVDTYENTNLILAGHSHNGTIRTPINHLPLERKKGAKKYNQEFYKINNTDLYISGGLGTSNNISIRLFCRPSINFYRLSSK